ncbi:PH domain-containing protein [Secundilactobacillus collinoides]|uniref:PH domain-containing protein n=1 Tax=Secundilactobacillus collinoides TaxID=33960 RepID=UPI0006D1491A|nr:PH domain-containing protein [Secundilactobacillus collinoides]
MCALIGLAIVVAILRYWRFTYQITPTDISINKGLIFRKQLQIPYSRIQTLQVKQWFYLKPFHLTAVSIETSGHDAMTRTPHCQLCHSRSLMNFAG